MQASHRPAGSESSCLQDAQEVHMWAAPFKFLPWLHAESSGHYENTWCLAPPRDADGVIWVWPGYLSPFSSCPDDSYVWFGQWPCVRSSLSHTLGSLGWFEGGTCLGSMRHLSSQDLGWWHPAWVCDKGGRAESHCSGQSVLNSGSHGSRQ